MSAQLEWNLYENGMDSIRHAIEHYTNDSNETRRYKYTILHLAQGVTLLLKERLRREHPNFVYTNVADETKTVDVEMLLSRLEHVAKVSLGNNAVDTIKELAKLRNNIEHFTLTIQKQQADSIICRLLPFLVMFSREELDKQFDQEVGHDAWQALLSTQEYRINAVTSVKNQLQREQRRAFLCSSCQANTASITSIHPTEPNEWVLTYSSVSCLVCNENICNLINCRGCGKEGTFQPDTRTILGLVWYCTDCYHTLSQEFPLIHYRPTLCLIGELKHWFKQHHEISGAELFSLLRNAREAGSGHFTPISDIMKLGIIEFSPSHHRADYERSRQENPFSVGINDYHKFVWIHVPS